MNFYRISGDPEDWGPLNAFLIENNWDDWFSFETTFHLVVFDRRGQPHYPGEVKIGQRGLKPAKRESERQKGYRYPEVPSSFRNLPLDMFSLGQNEDYYRIIYSLDELSRRSVLTALRDLAADDKLLSEVAQEEVLNVSLLRDVSIYTVKEKFTKLMKGDARLTEYHFTYEIPDSNVAMKFDVIPHSRPPSNIHAIIGRNGVGKTTMIRNIVRSALRPTEVFDAAVVPSRKEDARQGWSFSGIVVVSFSAFDEFIFKDDPNIQMKFNVVGLRFVDASGRSYLKSKSDLSNDFVDSLTACRRGLRLERLRRALEDLSEDDLFIQAGVIELLDQETYDWRDKALRIFRLLSSGHSIVLLIIAKLVELVDERTLVLIDEPEAHLHPPLLAAFLRGLSNLLISRNGVALLATHSPVVLQEIPKSCAWKLRRSGEIAKAERPAEESFGENVSVLTRDVFGLEPAMASFHSLIAEIIATGVNYEEVLQSFDDQLGSEGKALARALISLRDKSANR